MTGTKAGISPFRTHLKARLDTNIKSLVPILILQLLGFPQIAATSLYLSGFFQDERIKKEKIEEMIDLHFSEICTVSVITALISMAVLIILAISGGFSSFRYLHRKPETDEVFSLPVTKKQLFAADYLSGLTVHLIPGLTAALLSALLLWITPGHKLWVFSKSNADLTNMISINGSWKSSVLSETTDFSAFMSAASDFVITIVMVYTFAVLITVCCGNSFEAVVYFFASGISLTSFPALLKINYEEAILNNSSEYNMFSEAMLFSPFGGILKSTSDLFIIQYNRLYDFMNPRDFILDSYKGWAFLHILFAAVYFLTALMLFTKRKAEDTSKPFAFPCLFYITSFLITGTVVFTFTSSSSQIYSFDWLVLLIVTLVLSTVIFTVMLAVKERGIKIRNPLKQTVFLLVSFVISVSAAVTLSLTNSFGMMYWIPEPDSIEEVRLINLSDCSELSVTDPDTIKEVTEVHALINEETKTWTYGGVSHIEEIYNPGFLINSKYKLSAYGISCNFDITYCLKNGKQTARMVIPVNIDLSGTIFSEVHEDISYDVSEYAAEITAQSEGVFCSRTEFAEEIDENSDFLSRYSVYPMEYRLTDFDRNILSELLSHGLFLRTPYASEDDFFILWDENTKFPQIFIPKEYTELYESFLNSGTKEKLDWIRTDN